MKNTKYSHRDLSEKIRNTVTIINGTEITFFKNWLQAGLDYRDTRITFTSGPAQGKTYRITANTYKTITVSSWGGTIPVAGGGMNSGDKFYIHWDLTLIDASQFNNSEIVNSNFSVEGGMQAVFPDITGVTFTRCNLNNCIIPVGNTADITNCNKHISIQNNLLDWELDGSGNPVKCMAEKALLKLGLSADPKDISGVQLAESVITTKTKALALGV